MAPSEFRADLRDRLRAAFDAALERAVQNGGRERLVDELVQAAEEVLG